MYIGTLFIYNMGDKIKSMGISAAFSLWQKDWSCLTHGRIVHLYLMYQSLHDYDYHLPEIRYAIF
jgi:hypothetical protein